MKIILIILALFINSCSGIRDSAGVTRKSINEFTVVENPPLVIPPNFNLLPPNQLSTKKIDDIESELAQEILFGLDEDELPIQNKTDTMNQILLRADALDTSTLIRSEVDEDFMQEVETKKIFKGKFENEIEILDAVKESQRIREKIFEGALISEGKVSIKTKKVKIKKKKRFIFF